MGLTNIQNNRFRSLLTFLLVWSSSVPMGLLAQDKQTFNYNVDFRPGREDALLDIFKPISEHFEDEVRALGAAYTTGEILFNKKRYDDAAINFTTVTNKGTKSTYLSNSARLRLSQSLLQRGDFEGSLRAARDVSSVSNKFLAAEAWFTLARAYLAIGKVDRAEDAYKNILTVNAAVIDMVGFTFFYFGYIAHLPKV